jgi:putative hydrolase of the HAD superfamily
MIAERLTPRRTHAIVPSAYRGVVDAVIFDWGGTLTPWITSDGRSWWRVVERLVPAGVVAPDDVERVGRLLTEAEEAVWRRSREEQRSGTLAEIVAAAGLPADDVLYAAHAEEWEHATYLYPDAIDVLNALRERGLRIGVLSNTAWTRIRHEQIFARDGVDRLLDGAVYTSELPWTKPHPEAFQAAMAAIGVADPARCVFVGDRPFDDIFGAGRVGMRTVLLPHSEIPIVQRGHTQGEPDAVITRLTDLLALLDSWR